MSPLRTSIFCLPVLLGTGVWIHQSRLGNPTQLPPAQQQSSEQSHKQAIPEVKESFRAAISKLLDLPPFERSEAINALIGKAGFQISDADAAWFYEIKFPNGVPWLTRDQWQSILNTWILDRPLHAATFLEDQKLLDGPSGTTLMSVWAAHQPREVIDWALHRAANLDLTQGTLLKNLELQTKEDKARSDWLGRNRTLLTQSWASTNLDDLLVWVSTGGGEVDCTAVIASLKNQRGSSAVREWLETLEETSAAKTSSIRAAATIEIASDLYTNKGSSAAFEWVEHRKNDAEFHQGVQTASTRAVLKEPGKTLEWLDKVAAAKAFPDTSAEIAMSEWAAQDPLSAGNWLNEHRNSVVAERFIWAYAMQIALEDPEAAKAWAKVIPSPIAFGARQAGMDDFNEIGRQRDAAALEREITIAALAAETMRHPENQPSMPMEGNRAVLLFYNPQLVRASAGADPQLRMIRRVNGCSLVFDGQWGLPFPEFIQQPDGSLQIALQAARR